MADELKDIDLVTIDIKNELGQLSSLLPSAQEILDLALEACQEVKTTSDCVEVWCTLASQVAQSQPQLIQYFLQALDKAKISLPSAVYVSALEAVSAHLSIPEFEIYSQILDAASGLESEAEQSIILTAISPRLPQTLPELFQQVLETVERLRAEPDRLQIFKALLTNLPPQLLQRSLSIITSIKDEFYKVEALGALTPHVEQAQPDLIHSLLASVLELEDEFFRAEGLGEIILHFPDSSPELLLQIWGEVKNFRSRAEQFYTLKRLIDRCSELHPSLLEEALPYALQVINNLPSLASRLQALSSVLKYFPESQKSQLFQQILNNLVALSEEDRIRVLEEIAPQILSLKSQNLTRDLHEILTFPPNPSHRAKLFGYILAESSDSAQINLQSLLNLQSLRDLLETLPETDKVEFWDISAPYFARANSQLLKSCLDEIKGLPENRKNETLKRVISHVPKASQESIELIFREIKAIQSDLARAELFTKVLPQLQEAHRNEALQQSLNLALRLLTGEERLKILSELAPHLSDQLLNQALEVALDFPSEKDRTRACKALLINRKISRHDLKIKILKAGVNASSEAGKAYFLSTSLSSLSDSNRSKLLREITKKINLLRDEIAQSELISDLAKQLLGFEAETINQFFSTTLDIKDKAPRRMALSNILNQNYPEGLITKIITDEATTRALVEADLELLLDQTFKFSHKNNAKQILVSLTSIFLDDLERYIPNNEISFALDIIEDRNYGLREDSIKADFLGTLAPRLSIGLFGKALILIRDSIQNEQYRTDALCNLVPYIPSEQFSEVIQIVKQCITSPSFYAEILDSLSPYLDIDYLIEVINSLNETKLTQENTSHHIKVLSSISSALADYHHNSAPCQEDQSLIKISEVNNRILGILDRSLNFLSQESLESVTSILRALVPLLQSNELEKFLDLIKRLKDSTSSYILHSQDTDNLSFLCAILCSLEGSVKNDERFTTLIDEYSSELPDVEKIIIKTYRQDWLTEPVNRKQVENFLNSNSDTLKDCLWLKAHVAINSHDKKQDYINALKAIRDCKDNSFRIRFLEYLIPSLPDSLRFEVAEIARADIDLDSDLDAGSSQSNLGNEAQEEEKTKKKNDLKLLKAQLLVSLARRFPDFRSEAIGISRVLSNRVHRIQQLSHLAIEVPDLLLDVIENLEHIESDQNSGGSSSFLRKDVASQASSENDLSPNNFTSEGFGLSNEEQREVLNCLRDHLPLPINRAIKRETSQEKPNYSQFWKRVVKILTRSYRDALKQGRLRNDEVQDQDLLNLQDEINALTDLLLMRDLEPPMTVGILGGWGGGKSYIMHLMQKRMTEMRSRKVDSRVSAWELHPDQQYVSPHVGHIYQIKFDAWTFAKSDLWASLMRTIFFELNRQITLEQKLFKFFKDNGIDPDIPNSPYTDIWKVLYQVRDEERDYFLERVLQKSDLENLDPAQREKIDELLWKKRDVVKQAATEELHKQETALQSVNDRLKKRQVELENAEIQLKESQQPEVQEFVGQVNQILVVSGVLLQKRIGDDAFQDIRQQIEKLLPPDLTAESLRKFGGDLRLLISNILEGTDADGKPNNFSFKVLKQWGRKNLALIAIFCGFAAASVVAPLLIAWKLPNAVVPQLVAFIAPLLPALGMAQKLWRAGQRWYDQAKQALLECETQIKDSQTVIRRETQRLQKHQQERIRTLQADIEKLTQQAQELEKQVQEAREAVPENVYASLQDFVKDRIEAGIYDKHLGLMHQVKDDLTNLSYRLLPPPPGSQEYNYKLSDLKAVFPRGPARVVVYIDDLDRCPPDRVVQVLEAIQLLVKTPLFIAVLAIDERYITRALEKFYEGVLSRRGRPSGIDYLEKIIQLPYRVRPIMRDTLESYLRAQVDIQNNAAGGAKFSEVTRQEFNMLLECCQQVDLSPRTLKRLTNIYKLFKIVCRTRGTKPGLKVQKAILALLSLSGRYPELMRGIFDSIEACFEEQRSRKLDQATTADLYLESFLQDAFRNYRLSPSEAYLHREWEKLKHDALETGIIPSQLTLQDLKYELFNLIRSFSFVGDVGFSPEDYRYFSDTSLNAVLPGQSTNKPLPTVEQ